MHIDQERSEPIQKAVEDYFIRQGVSPSIGLNARVTIDDATGHVSLMVEMPYSDMVSSNPTLGKIDKFIENVVKALSVHDVKHDLITDIEDTTRFSIWADMKDADAFLHAVDLSAREVATIKDIDYESLTRLMREAKEKGEPLTPESFPALNINGHMLKLSELQPKPYADFADKDAHIFSISDDGSFVSHPQESDYYQLFYHIADGCDVSIEVEKGKPTHYVGGWNAAAPENDREPDLGVIEQVEGKSLLNSLGDFLRGNETFLAHYPQLGTPPTHEGSMEVSGSSQATSRGESR